VKCRGLGAARRNLPTASKSVKRLQKISTGSFDLFQKISISFPESGLINGLSANGGEKLRSRQRGLVKCDRARPPNGASAVGGKPVLSDRGAHRKTYSTVLVFREDIGAKKFAPRLDPLSRSATRMVGRANAAR
jgi:hypothetical protein